VDVVNTHSSTDSWLFSVAAKFAGRRLPVVRTRHISAPVARDPATRWLYVHGAHQVVTCGERMRQALVVDSRLPSDHLVSIPTGIDTHRFAPGDRERVRESLGLPADRILIGIVATLRSWKGHEYLIEAFHQLADPNTLLLIVGGGPQHENLQEQIAALDLTDRVIMPGNQTDVVSWLQALDIFALPSYANEGVPQALLQALACELPVVTTPVGSIEEAVMQEMTGLLVPPKDAHALAEALKVLINDESLRRRFGVTGRQHVLARFGLDHMLACMEDVFRNVMSRGA
jgi:glycosyltransferase involved in cell wall biosynthesis